MKQKFRDLSVGWESLHCGCENTCSSTIKPLVFVEYHGYEQNHSTTIIMVGCQHSTMFLDFAKICFTSSVNRRCYKPVSCIATQMTSLAMACSPVPWPLLAVSWRNSTQLFHYCHVSLHWRCILKFHSIYKTKNDSAHIKSDSHCP